MTFGHWQTSRDSVSVSGTLDSRESSRLLALAEQLRCSPPGEAFHELLHELYTQSRIYLDNEERRLRARGDSHWRAHQKVHDEFHEQFLNLILAVSAGHAGPFAVGNFAYQWWSTHLSTHEAI